LLIRRDYGFLLALRRSGVGVHLRSLLPLVRAAMAHKEGQQHPIGVYLAIWGLLFVLSTFSYLVDYFHLHGTLRWSLILAFMVLKAGLIVAIFMHMRWERLALMFAILIPPVLVLGFLALMTFEAGYTALTRGTFFAGGRYGPWNDN